MSNYLAIATVTATLQDILQEAALKAVPGAQVTTNRPVKSSGAQDPASINLFLYQVAPNTALRNADLPTRNAAGQLTQRPQVALNLYYLLSFQGSDLELVPQRLMGSALIALHTRPVLTPDRINRMTQATSYLAQSNLADQVELVKFSLLSLNLEEMSKLWSVFFQMPYVLSTVYQASVVLIEADQAVPPAALPVLERNIYVAPLHRPQIDQVGSADGLDQPITAGSVLVILGRDLQGDSTSVLLGGDEWVPQVVSDTRIVLPLAGSSAGAARLRAGVQGVQVIQTAMLGTPPMPHRGVESNVAAVVLHPTLTAASASGRAAKASVTVRVNPPVRAGQRVVLLLNEIGSDQPAAYAIVASPPITDTDAIKFPTSGVKAGQYIVRLQVDGAESLTNLDPQRSNFGPEVTIR